MDAATSSTAKTRLSPDAITAICATMVAVLALVVAIWQGILTREHNRLGVTPHIDIFGPSVEPDENDAPHYGLLLDNSGLGPARIIDYTLYLDGEAFHETRADTMHGSLKVPVKVWWLQNGDVLSAGRRRFVLALPESELQSHHSSFHNIMARVRLIVRYESFYGDQYAAHWPAAPNPERR